MGNLADYHAQTIWAWAGYYTPEQRIGGFDNQRPWESCMTISRRNQWSWGGPQDGVKTRAECLNMLIRCAGGDGNLLLNVGPMPTGEFAPEQVERMKEMGTWLAKYGESIYGTRGGPFRPSRWGVSTYKGHTVYLHIQRWPGEMLPLPAIPSKIIRSSALTGGDVSVKPTDDAVEISLPAGERDELDTIVALELDCPAGGIAPLATLAGPPSLATGKRVTASNVFQGNAQYGADKACDDDSETRWATDSGTKSARLEVDLGQPETIGRAAVEQAFPELRRVRKFAIEYGRDDQWQTCYRGEDLEASLVAPFDPVTAQRVRLNITEATDGPTVWEFELFPPKKWPFLLSRQFIDDFGPGRSVSISSNMRPRTSRQNSHLNRRKRRKQSAGFFSVVSVSSCPKCLQEDGKPGNPGTTRCHP